jgi:hypothetical protein
MTRGGGEITKAQVAFVGANMCMLRRRKGWSQPDPGKMMGWPGPSTVCAVEGRRGSRQRSFTSDEARRLAGIFGVTPRQLTSRYMNCGGDPPTGFTCLICGSTPNRERPTAAVLPWHELSGHGTARR